MTAEPELLWTPPAGGTPAVERFAAAAAERFGAPTSTSEPAHDYAALWRWSVENPASFGGLLAQWCGIRLHGEHSVVLTDDDMPHTRWFPGATINYVEQVFAGRDLDAVALVAAHEDAADVHLTWRELQGRVASLAAVLRERGVRAGDRVAGYLPNGPEAVVAFLAAASLGAVWAACGQDYSAPAALDRLGQLRPVALVAADGYRYAGRWHDRTAEVGALRDGLTGVHTVVLAGHTGDDPDRVDKDVLDWTAATSRDEPLDPVLVPFDHPLWVLFSSGTTGKPKGIVHGHGGVVLEHVKALALHCDLGEGDVLLWYTSPSWMMWNFQVAGLLVGATIVTYDGSPFHPGRGGLWSLAGRTGATLLGTSPGYVLACIKDEVDPAECIAAAGGDPAVLRTVGITGATLPASSARWLQHAIGERAQIASISGGTDVVSAFVGAVPTVPVWAGEISAPYLGVALDAFDPHGTPVRGEVGELVIRAPMPSMPVCFWDDSDGTRYRDAYFGAYPGVWRHGDWITITDRGSIEMHGRSDATLNRGGIRMGSADIYQVVESIPEIAEALVLGVEGDDGAYWMPLFVVLAPGAEYTDALGETVAQAIRSELSPRHVPDEIVVAPGIPHTRTGKKLEVPLKRLLQGADPAAVVDRTAIDDGALLDWFVDRYREVTTPSRDDR